MGRNSTNMQPIETIQSVSASSWCYKSVDCVSFPIYLVLVPQKDSPFPPHPTNGNEFLPCIHRRAAFCFQSAVEYCQLTCHVEILLWKSPIGGKLGWTVGVEVEVFSSVFSAAKLRRRGCWGFNWILIQGSVSLVHIACFLLAQNTRRTWWTLWNNFKCKRRWTVHLILRFNLWKHSVIQLTIILDSLSSSLKSETRLEKYSLRLIASHSLICFPIN